MIRNPRRSIAWRRDTHGANEKVEPVPVDTLHTIRKAFVTSLPTPHRAPNRSEITPFGRFRLPSVILHPRRPRRPLPVDGARPPDPISLRTQAGTTARPLSKGRPAPCQVGSPRLLDHRSGPYWGSVARRKTRTGGPTDRSTVLSRAPKARQNG